ncbi:hypothetical protein ACOSQ4_022716 [Xanthoceras sorbifolium]
MHEPQVLLGRSTYNRLVKLQTGPQDAQDLGQQKAAPLEHRQPQAQLLYDDRILTAIVAMQASFEGRMKLMEAKINSCLDVMEAGMIGLRDRMNTMGSKIDRIEIAIIQHYSRRRSRTLLRPPSR